jgi:hypothetical protein
MIKLTSTLSRFVEITLLLDGGDVILHQFFVELEIEQDVVTPTLTPTSSAEFEQSGDVGSSDKSVPPDASLACSVKKGA